MMQGLSEDYYKKWMNHLVECGDCWKVYISSLHIINTHLEQTTKEKEGIS